MTITDMSIIFLSLILETIPFLMLGVLLSSLIQEFVSEDLLKKIIPKNPFLGSLVGVILGFFIPTCDCAIIPVTRRLIKKKVPLNVCISFMLASPIVNPISILSTVYAFRDIMPKMIYYRVGFGIIIALLVGVIMTFLVNKKDVLNKSVSDDYDYNCDCGATIQKGKSHFWNIMYNSSEEFIGIMKYLIIGALITTIAQYIIAVTGVNFVVSNKIIQIVIMMIFAYIISLCSTSDAFIGRSFINQISNNSILVFLLLGAMIDLKNTIVLNGNFTRKFVFRLIIALAVSVFIITSIIKI